MNHYIHQLPSDENKDNFFSSVFTNSNPLLPWEGIQSEESPFDRDFNISPHQWFNTQLRLNDICDIDSIEVPGAMIMLPWGQKICEQFSLFVRERAEEKHYQEYAYPHLVPQYYFNPLQDLIQKETELLSVHVNKDNEVSRYVLSPTGECSIYHHWHSLIKKKEDLPKKIFQRTKYFRPITSAKRSGGSVFLSMEASDVFEFHSCFSSNNEAINEAKSLWRLFQEVSDTLGVFVLWTLRPVWTNRENLYQWSFGGDAILPSKHSVQVACSYYQENIFSKRFDITFRDKKERFFTSQATGAITRRLIFAHLFQSIRADGSLCLHPNIAPYQILILCVAFHSEDELIFMKVIEEIKKSGIRCQWLKIHTKRQLHQEQKRWYRFGIPLKMLFFGREKHEKVRIVITRHDTEQEITLIHKSNLNEIILMALKDIVNEKNRRKKYQHFIVPCQNKSDMEKVLYAHHIASIPLIINKECVLQVESLQKGEVLGFYLSEIFLPCVISKKETNVRAYVSRRI